MSTIRRSSRDTHSQQAGWLFISSLCRGAEFPDPPSILAAPLFEEAATSTRGLEARAIHNLSLLGMLERPRVRFWRVDSECLFKVERDWTVLDGLESHEARGGFLGYYKPTRYWILWAISNLTHPYAGNSASWVHTEPFTSCLVLWGVRPKRALPEEKNPPSHSIALYQVMVQSRV